MINRTAPSNLDRKVTLQRLALAWEQIWQASHWPLIVAGLAVIVVASGFLQYLSAQARISTLVILGILFLASLRNVLKIKWPSKLDAMRRIETTAGLNHRKISSVDDTLVREFESPEAAAIWAEHKRRQWAEVADVPVSPPRSGWRIFDPTALRVPVALGALASLLLGPGDLRSNLSEAAVLQQPAPPVAIAIDAWLKPPAYTGKPPILLTSPAMTERFASGEPLQIPENAAFTVRVTGADKPSLVVYDLEQNGTALKDPIKENGLKVKADEKAFSAEGKLTRSVRIEIKSGDKTLASWPIALLEDKPPTLTWAREPSTEKNGNLTLQWQTKDDYGVRGIGSEIALADQQKDGIGFATNGPFLYDAPKFPIKLKKSNTKDEAGKSTQDLTAHPWAGLNVTVTLTAKDAASQESEALTTDVTLPERIFVRPLAQALIEQRKRLIIDPDMAQDVAKMFRVILLYPKDLTDRSGHLIRLSAIGSALENAATNEDIIRSVDDLWQLALDVEEGVLSDAKAELAELKKQLEEALRNGASDKEIALLMEKMREAMKRYLQAQREQWDKERKQGKNPRDPNQQQGRELTQQDIQKMLDEIEKLSKQGQKEQAQALLDKLNEMLQNLQPGESRQAGQGDPMGEMMDGLSDMMRQQQRLRDQTQRMPGPGQPGEQGQDGMGGENPQAGEGQEPSQQPGEGREGQSLADRQGALRDLLDQMRKGLGGDQPGQFDDAGRAMEEAERSLREGDKDGALDKQADALNSLREGAREMGRRMRERGQGQARNPGRDGEGSNRDDDPLGRPRASNNPDVGPDKDMVPSELAIRRAREILEQLRNRANGQGLTDSERGYIDRLLRGLY